jgi:hypothetical protein
VKRQSCFALLLHIAAGAALLAQPVVFDRTSVIVLDPREPGAVRKAAADLARDMQQVFGARPAIVGKASNASALIVAGNYNLPAGIAKPTATEAFRITAAKNAVFLAGADMRGTIYAIYEFSHRFLGVDPFHYWTDHQPLKRASLSVPAGTNVEVGSPAFRYRGWFINDEDLLTGWKPLTPGGTGISLDAWEPIFEALLRTRGNMIVPGTFIFPDEPQVRAAGERGLIITQHHIEVLGTNTWRWPNDQPYSFSQHPDIMTNAWRNAMRGYAPGQEVIWTVGYRGRHDRAFWQDDPSIASTDEARAKAIRGAIDKQLEIVRADHKNPYFLMNAWMEAVPLIQSGVLTLPAGVTLVWPDNGHGAIRDNGKIAKGQGVYYHTAMHDGLANQLTEMVPPARIERELGRAARAGATEYLLVNISDVRPYPLTTGAVMDIAVEGGSWKAEEYLTRWCREQYGEAAAPLMADYYRAYFKAPGSYGPDESESLADNSYHNLLRALLVGLIYGDTDLKVALNRGPNWLPRFDAALVMSSCREAEPRWAKARAIALKAAPLIPAGRRDFFQSHVLTQLDIQEHGNRALRLATEAWADRAAAPAKIAEIIVELKTELASLHAAEYGKWKGFYNEDRFVHIRNAIAMAEATAGKLAGHPVPADLKLEPVPTDPYYWLKSYQNNRWVDTREHK